MRKIIPIIILLVVISSAVWGQNNFIKDFKQGWDNASENETKEKAAKNVFIRSDGKEYVRIDKWKIHAGDNLQYASPLFVDSTWTNITVRNYNRSKFEQNLNPNGIAWLRTTVYKKKGVEPIFLAISQTLASEIYINGKKVKTYGSPHSRRGYDPKSQPFLVILDSLEKQTIAVKLIKPEGHWYDIFPKVDQPVFKMEIFNKEHDLDSLSSKGLDKAFWSIIKIGIFLILSIIHFNFYKVQPSKKSNLYFALFSLGLMLYEFLNFLHQFHTYDPTLYSGFGFFTLLFGTSLVNIVFLIALYKEFEFKHDYFLYAIIALHAALPLVYILMGNNYAFELVNLTLAILFFITISLVSVFALKNTHERAKIFIISIIGPVAAMFAIMIVFVFLLVLSEFNNQDVEQNLGGTSIVVINFLINFFLSGRNVFIAIGLSLYLSLDFTEVNKSLKNKLDHINKLSKEKEDILEKQKEVLEQEVKNRTADLNKTINKLEATQDQLVQKEKLASLGELTAGIAHEIQNPLNFVNNFSELSIELIEELEENTDPELEKELLGDLAENQKKINYHGKRASSIVKGMLSHSRASSGEKTDTDINALADEYLRLSFHGMRAKDKSFNSDFKTDFANDLPLLHITQQDIGRVLLNLLNNAFYAVFTKSKKENSDYKPLVEVKTLDSEDKVLILVKDNGDGIPHEVKSKVFQPFFTTKPTGEGTGLGLSLSYDIVTKGHGGDLDVESTETEGCTFIISLPKNPIR